MEVYSFLTECHYDIKHLNLDNLPLFYHTFILKNWQEYPGEKFSEDYCIHNKIKITQLVD